MRHVPEPSAFADDHPPAGAAQARVQADDPNRVRHAFRTIALTRTKGQTKIRWRMPERPGAAKFVRPIEREYPYLKTARRVSAIR
jgi:hypothetical protein